MDQKVIPVKVSLRCRPLVSKERIEGCKSCVDFIPGEPQICIGTDKRFTFDFIFHPEASQDEIYTASVKPLLKNIFKGYNASVLAYGQTGSGKTYTMGTAHFNVEDDNDQRGIIPRVICDLFNGIDKRKDSEFTVKVSFLEIYNEDVLDLLSASSGKKSEDIAIREDINGQIRLVGLTEVLVTNPEDTFRCLEQGSLSRTTGATAMNLHSSRSHAIFTIIIEQTCKARDIYTSTKFHLVDLAGSERAKKTQAQGDRFKEGVNINKGLLSLGNVISALCDSGGKGFIPYRDSKLTRLLQDSLGGNSHTVMVACISPADSNFEESLNTLRYADRARKIKNKPFVNCDPQAAELCRLKQLVQQLQAQTVQNIGNIGDGSSQEMKKLVEKNKMLEEENRKLVNELQRAIEQTTVLCEKALMAEMSRDKFKTKLQELREKMGSTVYVLNSSLELNDNPQIKEQLNLVKDLDDKIAELQAEQLRGELVSEVSPQEDSSPSADEGTPEDKDFTSKHTLRQAEMNRELLALSKALSMKQELASKMTLNDDKINVLKEHYETNLRQLEDEVTILQKEKESLCSALKAVQNNPSNKISEQRRKRLQELETQISQLKKNITEQAKIVRMKQQSDHKVKKLNEDIMSMKQAKVKLIRQMRDEAEKFRQWKQQKDREVAQLKQLERRRQYEFTRNENIRIKQQAVLRRKMEEAVAANKRLKEALLLQKSTSNKRLEEKGSVNQTTRVKEWLNQELNMITTAKEAKYHLQNLLDNRKIIMEELEANKNNLEEPPRKKAAISTEDEQRKSESSDFEMQEIKERNEALENELELVNVQISDLQQKISDVNQDEDCSSRWENVHSMQEAKTALKWLFEVAIKTQLKLNLEKSNEEDLKAAHEDAEQRLQTMKHKLVEIRSSHHEEILHLERENEEKVLYLLCQLPKSSGGTEEQTNDPDQSLMERLRFQEEEINRLRRLHDELQQKNFECEELRKELEASQINGKKGSLMPQLTDFSGSPISPYIKKNEKKSKAKVPQKQYTYAPISSDEEVQRSDSDDPDWRLTPFVRRIKAKSNKRQSKKDSISDDENKKRSSTFKNKCKCKTNCSTMKCNCKKEGIVCSDQCKCMASRCSNRIPETESSANESPESHSNILTDHNSPVNSAVKKEPADEKSLLAPLPMENIEKYGAPLPMENIENYGVQRRRTQLFRSSNDSKFFKEPL